MNLIEQLTDYVNAAFTGLWVQTQEPDEAEREILQHARQKKWKAAVDERQLYLPSATISFPVVN
jgi:hypothetical protein